MFTFELTDVGRKRGLNLEDIVGYLPQMVYSLEEALQTQFNETYSHGGGWEPFNGFTSDNNGNLKYPGDPVLKPLAKGKTRHQEIFVYTCGWVMVRDLASGVFEVCRMD